MDYDILDGYLSGEEGVEVLYVEEDPEVRAALASAPARPPAPTPAACGGISPFSGEGAGEAENAKGAQDPQGPSLPRRSSRRASSKRARACSRQWPYD